MTALELILHLAEGSTTPNTLQHIAKIARQTIEAKKALADQPAPAQQEPVAWMHTNAIGHVYFRKNPQDKTLNPVPLYTSPPAQRKPLTDEQILADEILRYHFGLNGGAGPVSKKGRLIVNAIEAAHGIGEQK